MVAAVVLALPGDLFPGAINERWLFVGMGESMSFEIKYWLFEEDRLLFALADAVESGDLTSDEADTIKRFLNSDHARHGKLIQQSRLKTGEEL